MNFSPPTPQNIALAAERIRSGELVVIPTETVYGLAADAMNEQAVSKVFIAKGRPSDNPLIVHLADLDSVSDAAAMWPDEATTLARTFWPGPLTLVLPKSERVPDITTGGLDTVALRMPAHPVALALIKESGRLLAAPSANRFMGLSPTSVGHLDAHLLTEVAMVLDGGACAVGIESTVLDLTAPQSPAILRQGRITKSEIEGVLGLKIGNARALSSKRSPGNYPRHYAPKTPVRIVEQAGPGPALVFGNPRPGQILMPPAPAEYAAQLYDALFRLDKSDADHIDVEAPPNNDEWEAIWDRLRRASSG